MKLHAAVVGWILFSLTELAKTGLSETTTEYVTSRGAYCTESDFSPWSQWSTCSVTCGEGSRFRTRDCNGAITSGIEKCIQTQCGNVSEPDQDFKCSTGIEVSFLIDTSGSVGLDNFKKIQQFTKDVTTELKSGYERLNLTIITFNNEAKISLSLNESSKLDDLLKAEETLIYTHGGTETHKALQLLQQSVIRNDTTSPKVAIVITDGSSWRPDLTKTAAELVKKSGVVIYAVGVGDDFNPYELSAISSDPDDKYFFRLNNYGELSSLIKVFSHQKCPVTSTTQAVTTTETSLPTTTITSPPNEMSSKSTGDTKAPMPVSALTPTARPVVVSTKIPTPRPSLSTVGKIETLAPPTDKIVSSTFKALATTVTSEPTTSTASVKMTSHPVTTSTVPKTQETTSLKTAVPTARTTNGPTKTTTMTTANTSSTTAFTKQVESMSTHEVTSTTETPTMAPAILSAATTPHANRSITTNFFEPASTANQKPTTENTQEVTTMPTSVATQNTTMTRTTSAHEMTTTMTEPKRTTTNINIAETTTTTNPPKKTTKFLELTTTSEEQDITTTTMTATKTTAKHNLETTSSTTRPERTTSTMALHETTTAAKVPGTTQNTETSTTTKARKVSETTLTDTQDRTTTSEWKEPTSTSKTSVPSPSTHLTTTISVPTTETVTTVQMTTSMKLSKATVPQSTSTENTTNVNTDAATTRYSTIAPLTMNLTPKSSNVSSSAPSRKSTINYSTTTSQNLQTEIISESSQTSITFTNIPASTESSTTKSRTPPITNVFTVNQSSRSITTTSRENVTYPATTMTVPPTTITDEVMSETASHETTSTEPPTTTTASCIAKVADVVFVVDSSGSIGRPNFEKIKEFIKDVILTFDVDSRYTRVALIEFSTSPRIEFKLHEKTNLTDLLEAVDNITYSGGGTMTSDALELMRIEGFDRERPLAPDIAVVITDGQSKFPQLTKIQAQMARAEGIAMFSIGIGNDTAPAELQAIASSPRFVFEVGDYQTLFTLDSVVAHRACGVVLPEEYHTRSSTPSTTTRKGCYDIDAQCPSYPRDSCSDYEPWARKNCPRKCGFCPGFPLTEPPCEDTIADCVNYGTDMCSSTSQYEWVDVHCRKFCGFCGNKTDTLFLTTSTAATTTATVSTASSCSDLLPNCSKYGGPSMCQSYGDWAKLRCAKYCEFCYNYTTVPSAIVNNIRCPTWKLPDVCTIDDSDGKCCPMPKCPSHIILTVKRH